MEAENSFLMIIDETGDPLRATALLPICGCFFSGNKRIIFMFLKNLTLIICFQYEYIIYLLLLLELGGALGMYFAKDKVSNVILSSIAMLVLLISPCKGGLTYLKPN